MKSPNPYENTAEQIAKTVFPPHAEDHLTIDASNESAMSYIGRVLAIRYGARGEREEALVTAVVRLLKRIQHSHDTLYGWKASWIGGKGLDRGMAAEEIAAHRDLDDLDRWLLTEALA